ncbi:MAG: AmmeMemoRadiSam system radical SAM enzyme [Clostridia bacterium]|nr:AmmeMemoRadiSam system radical SAM enzyme [Clostridia bacterium]
MQDGILAKHYKKIEDLKVNCSLCPHNCMIESGKYGICRARRNVEGDLYSLNYGMVTSIALDPIEKKPLYRFHPGSLILSVGTFGCNLKCSFCQNWGIAHENPKTMRVEPLELVQKAEELMEDGNIGIAYTYNEPSIWYEFIEDTAKLAKEHKLKNVMVTNGFIGIEPLKGLLPYIDAMNIDIKAFNNHFYQEICKARLEEVKRVVEIAAEKCHVEITTLVIPGLNDRMEEIEDMVKWLRGITPEIPLHLSRYFPNYKMTDIPPTPVETLYKARDKALQYLKYVYLGNI